MKHRRMLAWCGALIVLAVALVYFNRPVPGGGIAAPEYAATVYDTDAPAGCAPGEQLPDFTLTCVDGGSFALRGHRGQVTVINLWATWCAPCVKELPYFDRLQREHPDDVAVLAIHSDLITDDVEAYLADYDYGIDFAIDTDGGVIASVGGSTMLPQTVVLDRYGVVTYNQVGSVTYESIARLVDDALANGA